MPSYILKRQYTTWHLIWFAHICSRVSSSSFSFFTVYLFLNLSWTSPEPQMTLYLFFWLIFYFLSDCLVPKIQLPPNPTKCIIVKHTYASNFWQIICIIEHFHSFYGGFPELNPYRLYFSFPRDIRRRQCF